MFSKKVTAVAGRSFPQILQMKILFPFTRKRRAG
jgi:hypothetical protein